MNLNECFLFFLVYIKLKSGWCEYLIPCNVVKATKDGMFNHVVIGWSYKPVCKPKRQDLYDSVQVGSKTKFCVNVTSGVPFYNTFKMLNDSINCRPAKFVVKMTLPAQQTVKSVQQALEREFRSVAGRQTVTEVSRKRSVSNNKNSQQSQKQQQLLTVSFSVVSVGHKSVENIQKLIGSIIKDGQLGGVAIVSEESGIRLAANNLPDPPPIQYDPSKPIKREEEVVDNDQLTILGKPKQDTFSSNITAGFIVTVVFWVLAVVIVFILVLLYTAYRLRKKDEGSYSLNRVILQKVENENKDQQDDGEHDNNYSFYYHTKEYFA